MKIKPIFIYLGIFIIAVLMIVIFTRENETVEMANNPHGQMSEGEMPNDDIHKGMNMGGAKAPGSDNVTSNIKHQMEMLKKTVEENPQDTASVRIYAEMLASAHQAPKAVELLKSILEIDPNRVDVMLTITFVEYNRGNYDVAGEYTSKILKLEPNNPEAFYNNGAIEAAKGNKDKAKEIWQDLIKKIPGTEAARLARSSLDKL